MTGEEEGKEAPEETPEELEAPKAEGGKQGLFTQFPKAFWIVNSLELFERGAYYGTMAVLGVHVVYNLFGHLEEATARAIWGFLYAPLIFFLYFVPLISGALATKYGYRVMLLGAFSLMIAGYAMLYTVNPGQLAFLAFALFTMGIGAGLFKPIISATIGHITREEQRNVAYAIYYWMINLGAFLMPLIIGFAFPTEELFYFVFLLSTTLIVINSVIVFTLYKDPIEADKSLSVPGAMKKHVPALKDRKFILILMIYSGFWFLYALNHTYLGVYMLDFDRMPEWFALPFLATINPGTIICVGPFLAKAIEKRKSLNVMMTGIVFFCIGLVVVGFTTSPIFFFLGIIIFSTAEFAVHPGFIAYVSKIAPRDKLAIYMSWIFIPSGLGNIVGGAIHGVMYPYFSISLSRPKLFFGSLIVVGLLTLFAFIWYNRWLIRTEEAKLPMAARSEETIWTKPITGMVVLMFIPITIAGAWMGGITPFMVKEEPIQQDVNWEEFQLASTDLPDETGYSNENSARSVWFTITEPNVQTVTITLTWTDEDPDPTRPLFTNDPDEFSLELSPPNGTDVESARSQTGEVQLQMEFEQQKQIYYNGTGEYIVTIDCWECGDQVGPLGVRTQPDGGNGWTLEVSYSYYFKPES